MLDVAAGKAYNATMQGNSQQVVSVEEIGAILRVERKAQKLSIADTAAMVGVSPRFLGEIERGVRGNVAADKLLQLLALMGLKLTIGK